MKSSRNDVFRSLYVSVMHFYETNKMNSAWAKKTAKNYLLAQANTKSIIKLKRAEHTSRVEAIESKIHIENGPSGRNKKQ